MSGRGDDSDPMGAETESTLRAMADKAGAAPWSVRSTDIIGRAHHRRRRSREQLVIVLVVAAFVAIFVAPIPQLHLFHRTQSGGRSNIAASSTRPTTTVPVSASPWQPQGVQWLSPSAAYVVETRRCGARSCTRLLLTTDAGRHFNEQPAASTPVASDGLAALPTFANLEDAYRTVGSEGFHYALFQSDDAAQSWHPVTFGKGTTVYGLTTTANRVYAVVASCTGVYACGDYRLYRSTAGSSSWASSRVPDTSDLHGSQVGVGAFGPDVWVSLSNGGPVTLLFSSDGGRFFRVEAAGLPGIGCWPEPTSSTVVWLSCDTGNYGRWSRSSDGGKRFLGLPVEGSNSSSLEAVSDSVAYFELIASPPATLERTTNGGKTFRRIATPPVPSGAGWTVAFGGELHGLAIVRSATESTLWRTSNGGGAWTRAAP
jgi:photosystem II stability/assembly factor-like uncharacterized protein